MTAKPPFSRGKRPPRSPSVGRRPQSAVLLAPGARTLARRRVLQVLFAWELSGRDIRQVLLQIVPDTPLLSSPNSLPPTDYEATQARRIPVPPLRFLEAAQQFPGYVQVLPEGSDDDVLENLPPAVINQQLYQELVQVFFERADLVDQTLGVFVDRPFSQIDPMEKSLLRLGATEILCFQQTPVRVIINEVIELSKIFASADSHKYINSILDKLANRYRQEPPPFS